MNKSSKKLQYSRCCLRPNNQSLHEPYFEFNCVEIQFLVPYFTIMSGCFYFSILVLFAQGKIEVVYMMLLTIEFLLYILGHVVSMRHARLSPYCLFVLFSLTQANVCNAEFFFRQPGDQLERDLQLRSSFEYLARTATFFCAFVVPNIKFLLAYLTVYLSCMAALIAKTGDFDNELFSETISQQPPYVLACVMIFHISQSVRLNQFFREDRIKVQGKQMSDVLNSQSDAILAFGKETNGVEHQCCTLDFLFSNLKCLELFNYNFTGQNRTQANPLTTNPLDKALFTPLHEQNEMIQDERRAQRPFSLREILLFDTENKRQVESYSMKPVIPSAQSKHDKTIIIKRNDLIIDDRECQVVNFTDISTYKRLQKEEQNNLLLTNLNTTVHHEMLAPLRANIDICQRLMRLTGDKEIRKLVQTSYQPALF